MVVVSRREATMPAATTDNLLTLPRVPRPGPGATRFRPVTRIVTAPRTIEGAGFQVRRPFPGTELEGADPIPPPRSSGRGGVRPRRSQRRALAPAPGIRN